jgi:hypothetical protein
LPPVAEDDPIEDDYEDDEESDPRLMRAMRAYLAELAAMTPSEIVGDTTAAGVQAGGTEVRLVVPGTEILVRKDPDDPGDVPPSPIYGEEICPSGNVRGQFEPTEAVWQDDPTFVDKPGKRIVRLSPVLWRAELPMVTNRRTLLFGIERAPGAEPRRHEIFIAGESSGTPVPVKFRFTLKQPGRTEVIHETGILDKIPIGGPCSGPVQAFEVSLDVPEGVPFPPDNAFRFNDGEYLLEAELVRENGSGTGLKVGVLGESVRTHAPALAFRAVGILGSSFEPDRMTRLEQRTVELAEKSARVLPDFLPVASEPLDTKVFPTSDRRDLLERHNPRPGRKPRLAEIVERLGAQQLESYLNDAILADFLREMEVGGLMGGYDRVIVLTASGDFRLLYGGQLQVEDLKVGGFAGTQKVVVVPGEPEPNVSTVAHEVIHTFPFPFAEKEMLAECDRDYHNKEDPIAHGHQLTHETSVSSVPRDGSLAIMGPVETDPWITQCTYRHVLEYLRRGAPDPRVLLVQGFVGREGERTAGLFLPFYDLDGVEDLPSGGTGNWAIVLRGEGGDILSRHAWEPAWRIPHVPRERRIVSFAFRVLRPEGLARVDLEGPDGIADSVLLSSTDPVVSIVSPADGAVVAVEGESVHVEWRGSDPDGDALFYTVLYSSDSGERWIDAAVETEESSLRVPIDMEAPADAHRVLVRATDGGRSADAVQTLQTSNGSP